MAGSSVRHRPGWGAIKEHDGKPLPIPGDVETCMVEIGLPIMKVAHQELWSLCPKHLERTGKEDKHPSWSVLYEDRDDGKGGVVPAGTHSCFSCGYRGTFVGLVADVLEIDWDDAKSWVRKRGGIERARKVLRKREEAREEKPAALPMTEARLALYVDPPAEALKKRRLSEESSKHYGVLWDTEEGGWIIPIRDPDKGMLMGWQEKNERYFRNRPTNVQKSRTLFGYRQFPGGTAILLESPLDVLRLHSVGVLGGVSSYGVHVSDTQMELVEDVADHLVLALDNDKDGRNLTRELVKGWAKRIPMSVLNYGQTPDIKDIGDMNSKQIDWALDNTIPSVLVRR